VGGLIWDGTTGVTAANLNAPVVFDARVSASAVAGSPSGGTYATVTEALTAGRRSIFVEAGDYAAGFTVTQNNVRIEGAVPPGYDGSFPAVTFGGQITIGANFVTVTNCHVVGSTGYGFRADLGWHGIRLIDCTAYQSALAGFYLAYQGTATTAAFNCQAIGCVANDCGGTLYDGFYIGDYDYALEWLLAGCSSFASGRDGFNVCANGVAAVNAACRIVTLRDCLAYTNTTHGLRCGGRASVNVQAGHYRENGGAGIYLSTQETTLARSQVNSARVRSNVGGGVHLQAASFSQIITGVQAYGNGTNFINCGSCPGHGFTIPAGALAASVPTAPYAIPGTNNNGV
jgi:hypothetical protein